MLGDKGGEVICFNALVTFAPHIMELCLKKIFEFFPRIYKIKIDASYAPYELRKSILFHVSDDHILDLPSSLEHYSAGLGAKTRKHIKARQAKLIDEFASVNFVTKFGTDIEERIVDKIVQMNYDRMKHKGKVHGIDNNYKKNIYRYSQYYGCVVYLELNGEIVGGCIASIINKGLFLHVIAHDNNYSGYNVGEVCVFNMIQTSIEKGLTTLHFLWGVSELKRRFLAKQHILYSYFVYRNYSFAYLIEMMKVKLMELLLRLKDKKITNLLRSAIQDYRKKRLVSYVG